MDFNTSPTALFCALETALDRGDFARAAELQRRLSRLGFRVSIVARVDGQKGQRRPARQARA